VDLHACFWILGILLIAAPWPAVFILEQRHRTSSAVGRLISILEVGGLTYNLLNMEACEDRARLVTAREPALLPLSIAERSIRAIKLEATMANIDFELGILPHRLLKPFQESSPRYSEADAALLIAGVKSDLIRTSATHATMERRLNCRCSASWKWWDSNWRHCGKHISYLV